MVVTLFTGYAMKAKKLFDIYPVLKLDDRINNAVPLSVQRSDFRKPAYTACTCRIKSVFNHVPVYFSPQTDRLTRFVGTGYPTAEIIIIRVK
jgi:hypothetical protein